MLAKRICSFALLFTASFSVSCNQRQGSSIKKVPVFPVKGEATVDGVAHEGLKYQCIPLGDFPVPERANSLRGLVNETGEFSIRLYSPSGCMRTRMAFHLANMR
jgi:hypothetical protein